MSTPNAPQQKVSELLQYLLDGCNTKTFGWEPLPHLSAWRFWVSELILPRAYDLEQANERLTERVAEYAAELSSKEDARRQWAETARIALQERDRLRDALKAERAKLNQYGRHNYYCIGTSQNCSCGFAAALNPTEPAVTQEQP